MEIGNKAPAWTLPEDKGKKVSIKDYPGKWIVFYFYPRDNIPGCTLEAIDQKHLNSIN